MNLFLLFLLIFGRCFCVWIVSFVLVLVVFVAVVMAVVVVMFVAMTIVVVVVMFMRFMSLLMVMNDITMGVRFRVATFTVAFIAILAFVTVVAVMVVIAVKFRWY